MPKIYVRDVVLVGALILIVSTAWLAHTGITARDEITAVRPVLANLVNDESVTPVEIAQTLAIAREHANSANNLVHDPLWWIVSKLPFVGNTPTAIMTSTEVASIALNATIKLETELRALPQDSQSMLDPALINVLAEGATELSPIFQESKLQLAALDLTGVPGIVSDPVVQVKSQIEIAEPFLVEAKAFARVAPALLGLQQPTKWLVIFGNGAEARPAGGFPGGWGVITADQGTLTLSNLESNDRLSRTSLPNWLNIVGDESASLYNNDLSRVLDMGLSPDFELTGNLFWNLYSQNTSVATKGVLIMDEHALRHLMHVTGPVQIDGRSLGSEEVVEYVTRGVYAAHPNVAEKDAVLLGLARDIFAKLQTGEVGLVGLAKALIPAMHEGRIHAWAKSPAMMNALRSTPLAGGMRDSSLYTHAVAIANGGGNKLEAYLQVNAQYIGGQCNVSLPYRDSTLRIELNHSAPAKGLPFYVTPRTDLGISRPTPQGGTRELIYIHAPLGSELTSAVFEGKSIDPIAYGTENNRAVWRFDVEIKAMSQTVLVVSLQEPAIEDKPYSLMWTQPMTLPMKTSAIPGPVCNI